MLLVNSISSTRDLSSPTCARWSDKTSMPDYFAFPPHVFRRVAVLLRGVVPSSSGRTQLRVDYQRGCDPAYAGWGQGWRHGDQAVLLRSALNAVEQGKLGIIVVNVFLGLF